MLLRIAVNTIWSSLLDSAHTNCGHALCRLHLWRITLSGIGKWFSFLSRLGAVRATNVLQSLCICVHNTNANPTELVRSKWLEG